MTRLIAITVCLAACGNATEPAPPAPRQAASDAVAAAPPPADAAPAPVAAHALDLAACQRRLRAAVNELAARVPQVYPIYKTLDFGHLERTGADREVAAISIVPGRSWHLSARVGRADLVDPELHVAKATWHTALTDEGVTHARRAGSTTLVLAVSSDRWGDFDPPEHPIVKVFFDVLGRAADSCVTD